MKGDWLIRKPAGALGRRRDGDRHRRLYGDALRAWRWSGTRILPARGPVVVTGAAGGVGSVAVALLAKLGYHVIASTGRAEEHDYLKGLGAAEIIGRDELSGAAKTARQGALGGRRRHGRLDDPRQRLAMTKAGGAVAACGNAAGMDLPTSVAPFILRGVSLLGINSVTLPKALREEAWARLVTDLDRDKLKAMTTTIGFDGIRATAEKIVEGKVRGRVVVEID